MQPETSTSSYLMDATFPWMDSERRSSIDPFFGSRQCDGNGPQFQPPGQVTSSFATTAAYDDDDLEPTPINCHNIQVVHHIPMQGNANLWTNLASNESLVELLAQLRGTVPASSNNNHHINERIELSAAKSSQLIEDDDFTIVTPSNNMHGSNEDDDLFSLSSTEGDPFSSSLSTTRTAATTSMISVAAASRSNQDAQWTKKFKQLRAYCLKHGHCLLVDTAGENRALAQWVKRQRYQYKLKEARQPSTLTDDRQRTLEDLGFCWAPRPSLWEDRFSELVQFCREQNHCNVPARYLANRSLAIWVKSQRRQYKLMKQGSKSNMTAERAERLRSIGFIWNPRNL